jgi:cell volume regulation protein A
MIIGTITGSDGIVLINFDNIKQAQLIGIFALIIILFEGAMKVFYLERL